MAAILARISDLWAAEPVVITALIGSVLALLVALGVPISDDVKAAILALIVAIGTLIARAKVSSPATTAALQSQLVAARLRAVSGTDQLPTS